MFGGWLKFRLELRIRHGASAKVFLRDINMKNWIQGFFAVLVLTCLFVVPVANAATGTLVMYQSWIDKQGEAVNMATDTFIVGLTSSSYTPSASTHDEVADITNELSGSGYSRQTLAGCTFTQTAGVAKFDCNDAVFTASGGTITGRYFFIFDDTVAGDPLVGYGLLDVTPADVAVTDGNTLTVQWNASGIYTLTIQ